jgi:diacylglycerol kinase family enzyme
MKPALLINPNAWQHARDPNTRRALQRSFEGLGECVETNNADEVGAVLRRWHTQGVDTLVVSGGDGVFHRVVREMLSEWPLDALPRLLPLHGGTIGVIVRASASPSPLAALSLLRLSLSRGQSLPTKPLSTLSVGGRAVFNFGIGLFSFLTQEYAKHPLRGPCGVQRVAARMLGSCIVQGPFSRAALREWRGEILLDGAPIAPRKLVGLYATGLNNMWEFKGFPEQEAPHGTFRALHVHTDPIGFVTGILPFTLGWNVAVESATVQFSSELLIHADEPYTFLADGEFYEQHEDLSIRCGPSIDVIQL